MSRNFVVFLSCITVAAAPALFASRANAQAQSFAVKNSYATTMTALEVSEDTRNWKSFDIGAGLPSDGMVRIHWTQDANSVACRQYLRARFADGAVSANLGVDFCSSTANFYTFGGR
ncbi:MAG: hypothetical protein ACREVL_15125 [Solimonas sp.]